MDVCGKFNYQSHKEEGQHHYSEDLEVDDTEMKIICPCIFLKLETFFNLKSGTSPNCTNKCFTCLYIYIYISQNPKVHKQQIFILGMILLF